MRNCKGTDRTKTASLGKAILPDIMIVIENLEDPGKLALTS